MPALNWFAVVVAAVATFVLGGVWYSPALFYKPWLRLNAFDEEMLKRGNQAFIFGGSFVLQLVAVVNLAAFTAGHDLGFVVAASAAVGIGWVATAFGVTYLFERRPFALFAINAGYHIVSYVMIGVILGLWR